MSAERLARSRHRPHSAPVTFASELLGIGSYNGVVAITLGPARFTIMSGLVDAGGVTDDVSSNDLSPQDLS